jgi:hypothetical protein
MSSRVASSRSAGTTITSVDGLPTPVWLTNCVLGAHDAALAGSDHP